MTSEGEHGGGEATGESGHQTVTLAVPAMDCPSCAGKVDKRLQRLKGVVGIDLRPTTGTATVTFDPTRADESAVIAAIESAGYEVVGPPQSDDEPLDEITVPSAVWTSRRVILTWIGAVLLVGGLALEFVLSAWNVPILPEAVVELTLADLGFLLAVLLSGAPVVRSGYYSVRARNLDIDLLMGTAIVAATGIGLYVEAATLAVLFSIAELLEQYAMDRTRSSLRELLELAPQEATIVRDDEEVNVPASAVEVGDTVVVRPGQKIPVDGVVSEGHTAVDESPITGESTPVDKTVGDEVFAGTLNETGHVEFAATTTADETTLAHIIELVRNAQANKTEKERFVDRFAGYYMPTVVAFAVLTAFLPPLLIESSVSFGVGGYTHTFVGGWRTWFVRGLTLLVIACPCAFVISTPVTVVSGVTAAARNGVLIKSGRDLEAMGEVDAIAFDKTGTLTKGALSVTDIIPIGEASEDDVLRHAAALEQGSDHPIAVAIRERADRAAVRLPNVSQFESITGKGVRARLDGERYYAGSPGLFDELGVDLDDSDAITDGGVAAATVPERSDRADPIRSLQEDGKTVVLVGTDDRLLGLVGVADEIRPGAARALERLHELGVAPLVMLTGDNEGTARSVAEELGIDEYRAELLPEEKVSAVESLEAEYGAIAMIGDGINDAPALASATVGVAMGAAGTDTALETADIALMGDDLGKLPYLYALSHRANGVIRQNIWTSLGVKFLLALGVPFGVVTVAMAVVIGDMGMSLGVTGNAMRLSRLQPDRLLND